MFRRAFLKRWNYRVDDSLDERAWSGLAELRAVLRKALASYTSGVRLTPSMLRALHAQMNRTPVTLLLGGGPGRYNLSLRRAGDAWGIATAEIATSAARLIAQERTVKECSNPHCSWMFVDESRPGSRRWCDVSVCGSLINVRRHRAGHRNGGR